jgi:hypothetical protein
MEILTPEWNAAFKKLWADFPLEMMVARHKHGMKPADHFDAAVARLQNEKEARAKFNCGTQECNGAIMCDRHYRQFVGVYD